MDYYNATSAGEVQRLRLAQSLATNPAVINTVKQYILRAGESALYLSVFSNTTVGVAPKKYVLRLQLQSMRIPPLTSDMFMVIRWVQIFFREERLPVAEGWKRPAAPITLASVAPIQDIINEASQWPGPGSQTPSTAVLLAPDVVVQW